MSTGQDIQKSDQFLEMEKRDEEQVLAELQGKVIEEMFYETKDHKVVISWVGIKEIARRYGGIEMCDPREALIQEFNDFFLVSVKATDTKNNYSMLGASVQSKLMDVHDLDEAKKWKRDEHGNYVFHKEPDPFTLQKAVSKAQRNAIRALIPEAYFAQMIETWKRGGKPPQQEKPKKVDAEAKVKGNVAGFVSAADLPKVPEDFKLSDGAAIVGGHIMEEFGQQADTVRALIYREMQTNLAIKNDEEAANLIQKQFAEKVNPAVEPDDVSYDKVIDIMNKADFDPQLVTISPDGDVVKPKKFLGDLWGNINEALRNAGYQWIREGRDSRWVKGESA
jgi:hypothetical protein